MHFLRKLYFFIKNLCTSVHFWVFGALWCPETLKWAYLGNQLSVRDEPKNTFYRRRWPTDRAIFYGPWPPWLKSCRLLKKNRTPFFGATPNKIWCPAIRSCDTIRQNGHRWWFCAWFEPGWTFLSDSASVARQHRALRAAKMEKWALDKLHVRPYKVASRAFVGLG